MAPEPDPGLQHPGAREHVGQQQQRPEVLGIDDLGPPRHLEHEVRQRGPQDREPRPLGGLHTRPLGLAEHLLVPHEAGMGVEGPAGLQCDEVATALPVDDQHGLARLERLAHDGVRSLPSTTFNRPMMAERAANGCLERPFSGSRAMIRLSPGWSSSE